MTQLLNLSRAARLAGVSRSEIQSKIRSGELQTFEGAVQITDLLRVFPQIDLDYDPTFEQMEQIKADARPRFPWQESEPPSAELLLRRLQSLGGLLVQTKSALDQNTGLLTDLAQRLKALAVEKKLGAGAQNEIQALHDWLEENLENQSPEPDKAAKLFAKNLLLHIIAPGVRFIPSGHEFQVEGGDTILDAAIRSGNNVKYGCSDGTCGDCKARVISGQVLETRSSGHKLSSHEQQMGYRLMCCNTAVTDLTLEVAETVSPADLPAQKVSATVSSLQALSEDKQLLRFKMPKSRNFRFFAGQHATLTLPGGAGIKLPMVSCPCDRGNLDFIIGRKPDDPDAEAGLAGLQPGETVTIAGPDGNFVLFDGASCPSLFISCGDGFVPVKSLIEHAISIDRIETYHLYRFASPGRPAFYDNLCRAWRDAFDNFTYTNEELEEGSPPAADQIAGNLPDLGRFDAYVAGPRLFTEAVRPVLIAKNLHPDRLRIEVI